MISFYTNFMLEYDNYSHFSCFYEASLHTSREEHDSDRLVAATPGSEAQGDQGHEEGEQGEGRSPQQQGQGGNLPV